MKWHKKLGQRGDTIVEVLVVLTILSFAFAISSATANKGLQQSRNAEEHSQAMGYLNGQVELLRKALSKSTTLPASDSTHPFCLTDPSTPTSGAACTSGTSVPYTSSIYISSDSTYYVLTVTWPGSGTSGQQREVFNFRVYNSTTNPSGGSLISIPGGGAPVGGGFVVTPPPPPIINVSVKMIPPAANNTTPVCTSAATLNKANISVTLTPTTSGISRTVLTNNSSVAIFNNLAYGASYQSTLNIPNQGQPGSFGVCPPATGGPVVADNSSNTINMKIYPVCYSYIAYYNSYWKIDGLDAAMNAAYPHPPANPYWGWTVVNGFYTYNGGGPYYFAGTGGSFVSNGTTYYFADIYDAHWQNDPVYANACPS